MELTDAHDQFEAVLKRAFVPLPVADLEQLPLEQQAPLIAVWNVCLALHQVLREMVPEGPARERAIAELKAVYEYARDGITDYRSLR